MTEQMPGQLVMVADLLDPELDPQPYAAAQDRDQGMAHALTAQDVVPWPTRAREWIAALPPGSEVTSELLTAALGLPRTEPGVNANNAVGAVMRAAATAGLLTRVGYTQATRKRSHARVLTLWRRTLDGWVD